ncbi:MAG: helix-turn-helix transcriptional regulator [Aureispira sp.]|nr:helix-turn-helix transcriptional regulator [Aureispira sp.]
MILDYKAIKLFGKPLFTWALVETPMTLLGEMLHNEACFAYVLEGTCLTYTGTEMLKVQQQEAFLSKCGNYTTKLLADEVDGQYSTIAVHFHLEVLHKVYENALPEFLTTKSGNQANNMTKVISNELIDTYIQNIHCYFKYPEYVAEELLILKLKEIILLLLKTTKAPDILAIMHHLFSPKTIELKEIVEAHHFSDLNITELAQLSNRSLSTFKKDFKDLYQDTPANYRMNKRLEKVAHLLSCSDDRISTITYACGFKSISHLSRIFKEHYSVSPSQYRLNLLGK